MLFPLEKPDFDVSFEEEKVTTKDLDKAINEYIKVAARIAKYVVGAQGLLQMLVAAHKLKNYSKAIEYMNHLTNRYGETLNALNREIYQEQGRSLDVVGLAKKLHISWKIR